MRCRSRRHRFSHFEQIKQLDAGAKQCSKSDGADCEACNFCRRHCLGNQISWRGEISQPMSLTFDGFQAVACQAVVERSARQLTDATCSTSQLSSAGRANSSGCLATLPGPDGLSFEVNSLGRPEPQDDIPSRCSALDAPDVLQLRPGPLPSACLGH